VEGHFFGTDVEELVVGDCGFMGVAAEVFDYAYYAPTDSQNVRRHLATVRLLMRLLKQLLLGPIVGCEQCGSVQSPLETLLVLDRSYKDSFLQLPHGLSRWLLSLARAGHKARQHETRNGPSSECFLHAFR
jgi:hypothetical protein